MGFLALIAVFAFSLVAVAQDAQLPPVVPTADLLQAVIAAIGGMKGMGGLAIAAVVTQLLVKLLNSELMSKVWSQIAGTWKLVAVFGMMTVNSVLSAMVSGTPLMTAVLSSGVISSVMVVLNELYKHMSEPKPPVVG